MSAVSRETLPAYLAPLPRRLEDLALRYAWVIVAINLAGTAFGFWYYRFQPAGTPLVVWPFGPNSPAATLFVALSLAAWKLSSDDTHAGTSMNRSSKDDGSG